MDVLEAPCPNCHAPGRPGLSGLLEEDDRVFRKCRVCGHKALITSVDEVHQRLFEGVVGQIIEEDDKPMKEVRRELAMALMEPCKKCGVRGTPDNTDLVENDRTLFRVCRSCGFRDPLAVFKDPGETPPEADGNARP